MQGLNAHLIRDITYMLPRPSVFLGPHHPLSRYYLLSRSAEYLFGKKDNDSSIYRFPGPYYFPLTFEVIKVCYRGVTGTAPEYDFQVGGAEAGILSPEEEEDK